MHHSTLVTLTLLLSGALAAGVGAGILLVPHVFHGLAGLSLGNDISLLNEIRAAGGLVLICGLFILSGAARPKLAFPATLVALAVYLGYGLSRIFAMFADGLPNTSILQITGIELIVSALCVVALRAQRGPKPT